MSRWERARTKITADETQHDLRQAMEESVFPYIPKARQQRSGLLIDFMNMKGTAADTDLIDLLMLGENRFGVLRPHSCLPGKEITSAGVACRNRLSARQRERRSPGRGPV